MEIITVILLVLIGVILLIVEFMLIPGITVAGVLSAVSFVASIVLSFRYFGNVFGYVALVAILVSVPAILYFLFKSRASKSMMLESDIDSKVETVKAGSVKPGDVGVTIGRCAPGGNAKINGNVVEVRSQDKFIDPHTEVEVVDVEGNIVIVKPLK